MGDFGLSSIDIGTFDPAARSRPRRRIAKQIVRQPLATHSDIQAPDGRAADISDLREAVASLARQLSEAQAANAATVAALASHIDEPRRRAQGKSAMRAFLAARGL